MNETPISTVKPVPLHGVIDQCVKTRCGTLVPVDTKSRKWARVKESDRIQLGVYATILRNTRNESVSDIGYIRFVHPVTKVVKYSPVILYKDEEVVEIYERRQRLTMRKEDKVKINEDDCFFCEFKKNCRYTKN